MQKILLLLLSVIRSQREVQIGTPLTIRLEIKNIGLNSNDNYSNKLECKFKTNTNGRLIKKIEVRRIQFTEDKNCNNAFRGEMICEIDYQKKSKWTGKNWIPGPSHCAGYMYKPKADMSDTGNYCLITTEINDAYSSKYNGCMIDSVLGW